MQFIAVGTPPDEDGSADLQYVLAAARNIGKYMNGFKVVVDKSTVPVGTADRVAAALQSELTARGSDANFSVVSNPEFLKEGAAVEDFMRPDRIVIGCDNSPQGEKARGMMKSYTRRLTVIMNALIGWMYVPLNSPNTQQTQCWRPVFLS